MMRNIGFIATLVLAAVLVSSPASARRLSVEIRTDKGHDAVYQPGDELEIKAKASTDAYLLVYEIDAEGYVHVLFPDEPADDGWIEGRKTVRLPERTSDVALVVQEPVGQAFIVGIAARDPFGMLPWYLRMRNVQAEEIGYHGAPDDEEEGVTADGRVVGDPFVAMERIRRQVVGDHDDIDAFATAYTSYYVHEQVAYPRYVCYDCHRPRNWNWGAGFDPYYTRCSTIDFRVNWSWAWGPSYWFGYNPYFVYVYRSDCPPHYRHGYDNGHWYSSWNGYKRWRKLWGGSIIRYKGKHPRGYVSPGKRRRGGHDKPGGYVKGGRDVGQIKRVGEVRPGSGKLAERRRSVGRGRAVEPRETTKVRKGKVIKRDRVTRLDTGKVRKRDGDSRLRTGKVRTGKVREVRRTVKGRAKEALRKNDRPLRKPKVQRSKPRLKQPKPSVQRSTSRTSVKSQPRMMKSNRKSSRPARSAKRSKG